METADSPSDGSGDAAARASDERGAVRRVVAFLIERFPPGPQLVLMFVMFVAATLMSGVLLAPEIGGRLGDVDALKAVAGLAGALLFIVRLRLYDDVKDADVDRVENPTRPIPRGLVTVGELDVAAAVVLVVEGALLASVGSLTFWCWAIAAAWSVLMRLEFFVSDWLDDHVATFAISHMVVLGLIYGALLALGIDARGGEATLGELAASHTVWWVLLAATSIGIGFEWGRKFERYFATHGERAWTLWMLWPTLGAIGFTAIVREAYPIWSVMALAVVTLATIVGHALVMGQRSRPPRDSVPGARGEVPTGPLREAVEIAPGAAGLLVFLVLAVAGVAELVA